MDTKIIEDIFKKKKTSKLVIVLLHFCLMLCSYKFITAFLNHSKIIVKIVYLLKLITYIGRTAPSSDVISIVLLYFFKRSVLN